ncbi:eb52e8f7-38d1-4f73-a4b0-8cb2beef9860 [Thermothielavioides terrestris]|uniref:Eb52e8f7-38d1-4f73-a4b0-8cb2beef9860 n=1 Tax=Thermothielavioides terrestris TaxID=2587410 RepID=A0A446BYL1_9PEZI|nr:eb52e8f7-38d1-4f73-a4b0-8cb2beef9860 [Thermothielavioides terrestris]
MGTRRPIAHHGLQHRPSRPSMLSEMSNDGSLLGKVNEDEDDDSGGSLQGSQHQDQAKTIEMLQRENMLLRQQQYQNARLRPRASTASAFGLSSSYLQEPVPEESDYAVDEQDELNDGLDMPSRRDIARRMSEFGVGPFRTPYPVENRKLENVKKAFWQSSLGFGGLGDLPQSRRHSFADVPTRQASIGSIGDTVQAHEPAAQDLVHAQDFAPSYPENPNYPMTNQVSPYFAGVAGLAGSPQALAQSAYGGHFASPYAGVTGPYSHRPTSPHRSMYGMSQPRHNQSLHIVLFKCSRADVFYIQEGTGLTVKPGDLVIVEADRGTDLGTVARDNVDWQTAKELKEYYAEEQYRWLMMYSQNAAASQDGVGAGLMAASNGLQGSTVGGMGPPNQHHHIQESGAGELKPKLIKRLAQSHEIHALREKEGNEAKAKRICQQKVKEHGLNMEILDAEFQMDWKKLTFYYFADTYINFNSLVTDLFKIYKTRIWMSAINPASFASPALGLQAPSGVGPGAVVNRSATSARRQESQQESQSAFSGSNQAGRGTQPSFASTFTGDRAVAPGSNYTATSFPYNTNAAFGNAARAGGALPFNPGMMQGVDAFSGTLQQGADYAGRGRFSSPQSVTGSQHDQAIPALGQQGDLLGSFQGLSLNSRST